MYYEEKVINGVLFWRDSEHGAWLQVTSVKMTADLLQARAQVQRLIAQLRELSGECNV